jgi:hypothetical protein
MSELACTDDLGWFRILRTLLDEVSIREGRLTRRGAATIARIWEATGRPPRGGLTVWRPYERLGPGLQQAMTEAAATALILAASGEIAPRGPLGRCLAPEPHREVYEGDREEWERGQAEAELRARCREQADLARRDPGAARQLLVMFTAGCRTYASFYRERRFLVTKLCIPGGTPARSLRPRPGRPPPVSQASSQITTVIRQHPLSWPHAACDRAPTPGPFDPWLSGN